MSYTYQHPGGPSDIGAATFSPRPAPPWRHVLAGMHLGKMSPRPLSEEFGAVLTLATDPGIVDLNIRHRHLPLSYISMDETALGEAVDWAFAQVLHDRTLLVRSDGGRQRPALVIACVCLRLGATVDDALQCVYNSDHLALSDFRYLEILRQLANPA